MCGRFTLHHTPQEIADRFAVQQVLLEVPARYNIAPSEQVAVVREGSARSLEPMQWGLVPFWAKDPEIGQRLINARAETIGEKPAFKHALSRRRCIIPSDGFYEWKKVGPKRQPMYVKMRDDRLFGFAGLWEEWQSPDGSPLRSCTIITVEPNALMEEIHNRMPAILRPEDEALWLDRNVREPSAVWPLLRPHPPDEMVAYPVSRMVNSPGFDAPSCVESITEGG